MTYRVWARSRTGVLFRGWPMNSPETCGAFLGNQFSWIPKETSIIAYIIKEDPFDPEHISRIHTI